MLACGWWQEGGSSVWSRRHAGPSQAGQEGQSITETCSSAQVLLRCRPKSCLPPPDASVAELLSPST